MTAGRGMPEGLGTIAEAIRCDGPISYERYIDLALYHPRSGYYRRGIRPGRDYITAPEVSALFGCLVGRFIARLPAQAGDPLLVLELGAGDGRLSREATGGPDLAGAVAEGRVRWVAADISYAAAPPRHRGRYWPVAADGLAPFAPMRRAVVLANEFFDALPRRVVVCRAGAFREVLVGLEEGRLVELTAPVASPSLAGYLEEAGLPPLEGARFEVCLGAREMLRRLADVVEEGLLVIFDYGGSRVEIVSRSVTGGTLRAFSGHSVMAHPLAEPGEADITADVNFDDLKRWGGEVGWRVVHEGPQREFMLALGLFEEVTRLAGGSRDPARLGEYLAAKRLLVPEGLQERFRVLVLGKGPAAGDGAVRSLLASRGNSDG